LVQDGQRLRVVADQDGLGASRSAAIKG
jgi:hypothetical protein